MADKQVLVAITTWATSAVTVFVFSEEHSSGSQAGGWVRESCGPSWRSRQVATWHPPWAAVPDPTLDTGGHFGSDVGMRYACQGDASTPTRELALVWTSSNGDEPAVVAMSAAGAVAVAEWPSNDWRGCSLGEDSPLEIELCLVASFQVGSLAGRFVVFDEDKTSGHIVQASRADHAHRHQEVLVNGCSDAILSKDAFPGSDSAHPRAWRCVQAGEQESRDRIAAVWLPVCAYEALRANVQISFVAMLPQVRTMSGFVDFMQIRSEAFLTPPSGWVLLLRFKTFDAGPFRLECPAPSRTAAGVLLGKTPPPQHCRTRKPVARNGRRWAHFCLAVGFVKSYWKHAGGGLLAGQSQ